MKKPAQIFAAILAAAVLTAASPYSDLADRRIKAMSPDRLEILRTGAGAGYALTAELNGYPGPRHVLDLADALHLTKDQRQNTASLFHQMQAEAISVGKEIIEKEIALDALFRHGVADRSTLFRLTAAIGKSEAHLRATHLKYHLSMAGLLTPDQKATYGRLRGYGGNRSSHRHR